MTLVSWFIADLSLMSAWGGRAIRWAARWRSMEPPYSSLLKATPKAGLKPSKELKMVRGHEQYHHRIPYAAVETLSSRRFWMHPMVRPCLPSTKWMRESNGRIEALLMRRRADGTWTNSYLFGRNTASSSSDYNVTKGSVDGDLVILGLPNYSSRRGQIQIYRRAPPTAWSLELEENGSSSSTFSGTNVLVRDGIFWVGSNRSNRGMYIYLDAPGDDSLRCVVSVNSDRQPAALVSLHLRGFVL